VRPRQQRALRGSGGVSTVRARHIPLDEPRRVRNTTIDFGKLGLPKDVRYALADAFWNHVGPRGPSAIQLQWHHLRCFARFYAETRALRGLADLDHVLLLRYIEWLGQQRTPAGEPLSKSSRCVAYTVLRKLLQWLERCRPRLLKPINYPFNPFPGRRREARPRRRLSIEVLRAILRACESDIESSRAKRIAGQDPTCDLLMPYYIAILVHTAGNPYAIAALRTDCLRPMPLLDDREMLVWEKPRASTIQRRAFRLDAPFDPPGLVRDILQWTSRLRRRIDSSLRDRLFIYLGPRGAAALAPSNLIYPRRRFAERHKLHDFELAGLRPSVLTAFYRASGDLNQVRAIANHAQLSTTISYVESPEVQAQNRFRIASLQTAFLGHVCEPHADTTTATPAVERFQDYKAIVPAGEAVSMFGFSCLDPFSGIAAGTRAGELCSNFLGCLTCPNAILTHDARTVARLLQARDHMQAASAQIHPARWSAIYAPQLAILEHDILARFSAQEIGEAQRLRGTLASLPPLQ
jgi:hypothetical protein